MTENEKRLQVALMNLGADIRKTEEALNKGRALEHAKVYSKIYPWLESMKVDLNQMSKIFSEEVPN